ncbi:MAG: hypothetical protein WD898_02860 [Candidatus Paceibacterota bacterium]
MDEKNILSPEQIEEKRVALEEKHNTPIKVFCFMVEGRQVIGYTKEAPRITKMRAFDKMIISITEACEILLDAMLIKDASDPLILTDDKIYLSACMECQGVLLPYSNTLKKN